jgi:hypothetical protein
MVAAVQIIMNRRVTRSFRIIEFCAPNLKTLQSTRLALSTIKILPPCNQLDGGGVAALLLLQEPWAVTAQLTREVLHDVVGAVVSDDVVGAVAEEFDAAALDEFTGFLLH